MDDSIVERLKNYANNFDIIKLYLDYDIRDRKVAMGWAHPLVLQAIAELLRIDLYIWQKDGERLIPHQNLAYHHRSFADLSGGGFQRIDLLFNGNHFDRLKIAGDFLQTEFIPYTSWPKNVQNPSVPAQQNPSPLLSRNSVSSPSPSAIYEADAKKEEHSVPASAPAPQDSPSSSPAPEKKVTTTSSILDQITQGVQLRHVETNDKSTANVGNRRSYPSKNPIAEALQNKFKNVAKDDDDSDTDTNDDEFKDNVSSPGPAIF